MFEIVTKAGHKLQVDNLKELISIITVVGLENLNRAYFIEDGCYYIIWIEGVAN